MDGTGPLPNADINVNGTLKSSRQANGPIDKTKSTNEVKQTNGIQDAADGQIPATEIFAEFVARASPGMLTSALRDKLKEVLIDYIGVVASGATTAPSTESIYKGILSLGAASGSDTVLTKGQKFSPQYAALLNATFGHSLDFDDTYAPGTLHAGVTVISAALALAEALGAERCSSELAMIAIAVGYEITCRLGRELGDDSYAQGMHNTATAGIFGAVATIAVLKHLPARTVEMAFGLAGSKAAGSMQYLENGSWNKRLHPGFAAHDAFVCVALAENGVIGAEKIIEGKLGFLHAYSPKKDKDLGRLTEGLGEDWTWLTSSLKPYPACRMTHGFIEMAGEMAAQASATNTDVKHITLSMPPANFILVGRPQPNKVRPQNVVDAQFSAYFQTAHAWCHGAAFDLAAYGRLDDPAVHRVSDRITCVVDERLRSMAGRIRVEFDDGSVREREMLEPLGEVSHPFTTDKVEAKFLSLMTPVYGAERARQVLSLIYDLEQRQVGELMTLVQ